MVSKDNISKNITYAEATKSQEAIRLEIANDPNEDQLKNMKAVAEAIFEPLQIYINKPIGISSFFRSPAINKKIGGSKTSEHCLGGAIDIDGDIFGGITNKEIFNWIDENVSYRQLIWEFGDDENPAWVHVSYKEGDNKKEKLRASKVNGKTVYTKM